MPTTEFEATSCEYVTVKVTRLDGTDPTARTVEMAFVPDGDAPTTFYAGSWETIEDEYYAKCLIGPSPGLVELTAGVWAVYLRIDDPTANPILRAGLIKVN